MVKVTTLSEKDIEAIGTAFADYSYADGEKGMALFYKSRNDVKEYICGYVRAMLAAGCLYSTSEKHEAFIAYRYSKDNLPLSAGMIHIQNYGLRRCCENAEVYQQGRRIL